MNREKIRRTLTKIDSDILIIEANSGATTLEQLQQTKVDCIFLDYYLGDMTADELVTKITYSVPIIIVTGLGDEQLTVRKSVV